jgi:hypothetical protein
MLTIEEAHKWMEPWSKRMTPREFVLLGGEPTLNKNLTEIVKASRNYWPNSDVFVVTNGFFLHLHPELEKTLLEYNVRMEISIHSNSNKYQEKLSKIKKHVSEWDVDITWRTCYEEWLFMYKGYEKTMQPFKDEDPRGSWDICRCKYCNQLLDGKIWKCPNIAYLKMQLKKYNIQNNEEWRPYLQYDGLSPSCSDEDLVRFYEKEEESICSMCPAKEHPVCNEIKNPLGLPIIKYV